MTSVSSHRADVSRLLLTLGFGVLAVGIIMAVRDPATSYEPSIFEGTTTMFWVGVAIAMLISVSRTFSAPARLERQLAVLLGGLTMCAIVALPLIRGYYYVGEQDPMTHLGIARDINAGILPMIDSQYPVIHTLGAIISDIGGIELTQSLQICVIVFVLSFFVYIPLVVREFTTESDVVLVSVFSGFLLLQLNFLGVHMKVHPTSQAIMYVAPMLYLFIESYRRSDLRFSVMLLVAYSAFVMLHPQQGANFLIFFAAVASAQMIHSVFWRQSPVQEGRPLVFSLMVFSAIFWVWVSKLQAFEQSLRSVIVALMLDTSDSGTATEIASRGVSLEALGGSYEEIFLRMYLVPFVYCLFAGLLMLAVTTYNLRTSPLEPLRFLIATMSKDIRILILHIITGFVAITVLFFTYLYGDITSQYFRHYGFIMVFATVMGAFAIGRTLIWIEAFLGGERTRFLTICILLLFVFLTIPVVYPSPYIYQTTGHVTENQMAGFEGSFEHWANGMSYGQTRPSLERYDRAINGERAPSPHIGPQNYVPDHFAESELRPHWDDSGYLPVTKGDRVQETEVYQGFRFGESDFRYLEEEPGIDKVRATGEFDLYLVGPEEQD